jgi:drug/metabolite transporter (DMT)-like permease
MTSRRNSLLLLHCAVLLFGVAGLFGKWVAADPVVIVCARAAVASLTFLLIQRVRREAWVWPRGGDWLWLPLTGAVLALHWVAFFRAIQVSTLAVALLAYATAPIFAALLEPFAFRERLSARALAAGAVTLAGVALIAPRWSLADATAAGVAWGVLSGFTFAVLSLLNRALVRRHPPMRLALYQDAAALLALAPLLPGAWAPLTAQDLALLGLLGVACTALAHTLFIAALRTLPARTAALVSALEPVYGILLAAALLGEIPTPRSLAGGALVLAAVAWVSFAQHRPADTT